MAARKKPSSPATPTKSFHPLDPFGLMGFDLRKMPIQVTEIPLWLDEMRAIFEDRWRAVEKIYRSGRLAAALKPLFGRLLTEAETRYWYDDEKQDHAWRVRLLDRRTAEGKMYFSYLGICCENGLFRPDPSRGEALRRVVLHLLDLESPPRPFDAPHLKMAVFTSDRWAKSRRDGRHYPYPMSGVEIPRRYSRARARRLAAGFVSSRSIQYWEEVQDQLAALIDNAMQSYAMVDRVGLLEQAVGVPAARLVKTVRDPTVKLSTSDRTRTTAITPREKLRAVNLYHRWYPLVRRCLNAARARTRPAGVPDEFRQRVQLASEREHQSHRITLLLIIDELGLSIGPDALRRKLRSKA